MGARGAGAVAVIPANFEIAGRGLDTRGIQAAILKLHHGCTDRQRLGEARQCDLCLRQLQGTGPLAREWSLPPVLQPPAPDAVTKAGDELRLGHARQGAAGGLQGGDAHGRRGESQVKPFGAEEVVQLKGRLVAVPDDRHRRG